MLLYVLLGVVALILIILVLAALKPNEFSVVRSIAINAPADRIFPHVNDFHAWTGWSPWEKMDPALNRTYSGPTSGKGAKYAWSGNKKVGSGSMEITDSTSPSRVMLNLDFMMPFEAHNTTEFTFVPQGGGTLVTWTMRGPAPFMIKVMHVFMDMDKMVGKDFDKGLVDLKAVSER